MKLVALLAMVACGSPAPMAPTNVTPSPVAVPLPTDAELGWLGFATAKSKDSWIPHPRLRGHELPREMGTGPTSPAI